MCALAERRRGTHTQFPVSPVLRQPAKERGPRARRTVALILTATKSIFLTRGYAGTTVDEIARLAGISRASFYTYFPSKRDVLLALGAESAHAALEIADYVEAIADPCDEAEIEDVVRRSFAVLDDHASFGLAWTQAAQEDEEIRVAGTKRYLQVCTRMGQALGAVRGRPFDNPAARGMVVFSMLDRAWTFRQLYDEMLKDGTLEHEIALVLVDMLVEGRRSRT
jgi:AcrR family transcriptional regulator